MRISQKYKPLFECIAGKHPQVDTIVITGGRDSSKSHTTSLALCEGAVRYNHRILYTRYTLSSAKDSIIPDFNEKIGILNYENFFHVTNDRIIGKNNDSKIVFKGIKTSAGNQTANLKSLKDFSIFVCEELEEYPSLEEWDKIQLSIRATDVQCLNVVVMNPTTKKHWSYGEFFQSKGVTPGVNEIVGNICYIHTTFEDTPKEFIAPKNLRKYLAAKKIYDQLDVMSNEMRITQSTKDIKAWRYYKNTVLGGWLEQSEGLVFESWYLFTDFPDEYELRIFGLDFGFTSDPAAFVECVITKTDIYLKQHIYETGLLNSALAQRIKLTIGDDPVYVVGDSASPKDIADLQKTHNLQIMPCVKGAGSVESGVKQMQDKTIHIHKDSADLIDEFNHYHTVEIINTKGEKKIHIVDSDNHGIDAARYGCTRYSI